MKNTSRSTKRPSRREVAADRIGRLIVSGDLRSGERLLEQQLALQLGMSRLPVREALRDLAAEGLVLITPRRGSFVATLGAQELADIYDARCLLESYSASLATRFMGEPQLAALRAIVEKMRLTVSDRNYSEHARLNIEFHRIVWENTPNSVIQDLIRQLWRRALRFRFISMRMPGRLMESLAYHEHLVAAFGERDAQTVERVTWTAIQQAKMALLRGYFGESTSVADRESLDRELPDLTDLVLPVGRERASGQELRRVLNGIGPATPRVHSTVPAPAHGGSHIAKVSPRLLMERRG